MAKSNRNLTDIFQDTANAIRGKTGLSEPINPRDFADEIDSIETGGGGDDEARILIEGGFSEISNSEATKIRDYAFAFCSSLSSVNIPNCSVIGRVAFVNCPSLTEANFSKCKYVGSSAFANCSFLTKANFPECLSIYSESAFYNCSRLSSISFPKCIIIGTQAFANCYSLAEANFPNCVSIGNSAFYNCSSLASVNIPDCLSFGYYAFASCRSLVSVNFPNCSIIGQYAFYNCSSLASVNIPDCLSLGYYAFVSCRSLSKISFIFCGNIENNVFYNCSSLTEANFPNCLSIWYSAFQNCSSLTSVNFPKCLSIGQNAFSGCYSLTEANFPNCLEIGTSAFYSCSVLTEANLPNCTYIRNQAFYNCSALSAITIMNMSTVVTQLGNSQALQGTPMADSSYLGYFGSIFVHPDRVSAYKSATNWAAYSDRITAAPSDLVNKGIWPYEFYRSTITEVPSEKMDAEIIGHCALQSCNSLSTVSLSKVMAIGASAFYSCSVLTEANLPNCEYVGSNAFQYCYSLTSISFPNCSIIGQNAFYGCSSLTEANFPNCVNIERNAFYNCSRLSSISFPNCLAIDSGAFGYCCSLTKANFPSCKYIRNEAFAVCEHLLSINILNCMIMGSFTFQNCLSLPSISLPNCAFIANYAFTGCNKFSQLYLLKNKLVFLEGAQAFQTTPMSNSLYLGYFGSIYVRASLLSEYQTAPNWSHYSERFVGVSNIYSTSASITNGSCHFDYEEVAENTSIEAQIIPDSGYSYPSTITVTGATYTYDNTTGVITLSNPTDTIVVTGACTPPPPDPILNNNSWDTIRAVCEAGEAANYWSLGDTKTDVGTDGNTRHFQIVDMQGLYNKHVVFLQVELEPNNYSVNQSTNVDGDGAYNDYAISDMRTTYLPAIALKYSNELQSNLTNTTYKVATNGNNGTILDLTDKLFLPALRELTSDAGTSRTEERGALTAFSYNVPLKKYKINGSSSGDAWFVRSPASGSTSNMCMVSYAGATNFTIDATTNFTVAPCFAF